MEMNIALGRSVREARKARGMTQEGLAELAGLDRTYISGVERGVRNPTVRSLALIARALGSRPSLLLRRAEEIGGHANAL